MDGSFHSWAGNGPYYPHMATTSPVPSPTLLADGVAVVSGGCTNTHPAGRASPLRNKDLVLVNAHVPYERETEATDFLVPRDDIPAHLEPLPEDKSARIVL